jgi:hypothetical protein
MVAAHCRCAAGNWIRERIPPELQARIPRVEDICQGRSRWLLIPPGGENSMIFPDRPVTREDFLRLVKRPPRAHRPTPAHVEAALRPRSKTPSGVSTNSGNVTNQPRRPGCALKPTG